MLWKTGKICCSHKSAHLGFKALPLHLLAIAVAHTRAAAISPPVLFMFLDELDPAQNDHTAV